MVTIAPEIRAEDAWLSTPESIATFRQQVEAIRPSASQFELASIEDRKITLGDRDINIRIYDPLAAAPQSLLIYVHGGGSSWTECKDLYFENEDDARSRFGSPLWAEDLSRMPSAYISGGDRRRSLTLGRDLWRFKHRQ